MSTPLRLAMVLAFALLATPWQVADAQQPLPGNPDVIELVQRFAPITMLKEQRYECDMSGEPWVPAPVEIVLGQPGIVLRTHTPQRDGPDTVLKIRPRAQDLVQRAEHDYIDLPGNPMRPGCDYARDGQRLMQGHEPTTYARVVVNPDGNALVIQYWFFYYFNYWNNMHEGDWEMIQVEFEADSISDAMAQGPVSVAYAQHEGGERVGWDEPWVSKHGDRPLVYPAAGSHASHFQSELYIGWGENGTGFGCDNAQGPSREVPLRPVYVEPNPDPAGDQAWALFAGRWGQRESWQFNGPRTPSNNPTWRDPFGSTVNWRTSSLIVPRSPLFGHSATGFFCGLSRVGSQGYMAATAHPVLTIGGILLVMVALSNIIYRARSFMFEVGDVYLRNWKLFAVMGLLTIPAGWSLNGLIYLLGQFWQATWSPGWLTPSTGLRMSTVAAIGGFGQAALILIVGPAVVKIVADSHHGLTPTLRNSYLVVRHHLRPIIAGFALLALIAGGLAAFVLTLPLAILLVIRWQFISQAVMLGNARTGIAALQISGRAIDGRWLKILVASVCIQGAMLLTGPVIGTILMLMGRLSVNNANFLSVSLYALALPITQIALTLLYLQHADAAEVREAQLADEYVPSRFESERSR